MEMLLVVPLPRNSEIYGFAEGSRPVGGGRYHLPSYSFENRRSRNISLVFRRCVFAAIYARNFEDAYNCLFWFDALIIGRLEKRFTEVCSWIIAVLRLAGP